MDLATKDLRRVFKKFIFWFALLTIVMSFVILITITKSGMSFFSISGQSMEPTLMNGDSVILHQEDKLKHNQIVFFKKPTTWSGYTDQTTTLVKRVTAIPGDTLTFDDEAFYVNGTLLYSVKDNNYECEAGPTDYEHTLNANELFATGDNANHSLDSRRIFCDGSPELMFIPKNYVVDYGRIVKQF